MYKLLIVDDERQIREGLREIVDWEQYGISACLESADGEQALDIIRSEAPQIVITDIQMPVMNGIELLRKIREEGMDIKVIVLSGYDDYELVRQAMKNGAIDYLLKPVSREDLIHIIDEITESIEKQYSYGREDQNLLWNRSATVNRLLADEMTPLDFKQKMLILGFEVRPGACLAAVINAPELDEGSDMTPERIFEMLSIDLKEDPTLCSFVNGSDRVCLIFWENAQAPGLFKEKASQILAGLKDKCGIEASMVAGNTVSTYRSLRTSYENAVSAAALVGDHADKKLLYFEDILNSEARYGQKRGGKEKEYGTTVSSMIEYAVSMYSEPDMSLQYLSDKLNGNAAYLGRKFKQETGVSFNEYLSSVRIEKAKELLAKDYKGTDISDRLGFSNYNYFYMVFKKMTGQSPMDYREDIKEASWIDG